LTTLYKHQESKKGNLQTALEDVFAQGFSSIPTNSLRHFFNLVFDFFVIYSDEVFRKDDLLAVKGQLEVNLKSLRMSRYLSYDYVYVIISYIDKQIQLNNFSTSNGGDDITLSNIVLNHCLKQKTFDRYEETLIFLAHYPFSSRSDLRDKLRDSVVNRHHIVPDYDDEDDISSALDSIFADDTGDNSLIRESKPPLKLLGFYVLVKYWLKTSACFSRSRTTLPCKLLEIRN
jgi:hypothetical protein